jgi:hypothetical protein
MITPKDTLLDVIEKELRASWIFGFEAAIELMCRKMLILLENTPTEMIKKEITDIRENPHKVVI